MNIAILAGTRPEVVKLVPVYAALVARSNIRPVWISTEQQGALNAQALDTFGIVPDIRLEPPSSERTLGGRFAQVMDRLDSVLGELSPDLVLVQGDTSTTAAGAMAAFARRIPIGHVEAGLRTFNLDSPFPEEGWRCVVGQLAALHFAPTEAAARVLLEQGVAKDKIHMTGNTGVDAIRLSGARNHPEPRLPGLRRVVVTVHRRENWGPELEQILAALIALRDRVSDIEIVFVAHANPALRHRVEGALAGQPRIRISEPLDYLRFLALLKSATLALSDSGGIQEEAPVLGLPLLVLRNTTERAEAVEAGVAAMVGVDTATIVETASILLTNEDLRMQMVRGVSPFGDGFAAHRIVDVIADWHPDMVADGARIQAAV
ncbi:MAG: UDP-N-acetylglucosamine 2-epimerase (non-hydrolyzing) [Alphaproteobacteria bacterium]|nr:UDP-N-acetylglucosamine 2-epimerase (non-hydrolyzing) [Alphaproteobacteria bacterium]